MCFCDDNDESLDSGHSKAPYIEPTEAVAPCGHSKLNF